MYSFFRNTCERLLRIPPDPQPPPGDETRTRLFRAAPNYYKYLLVLWGLKSLLAAFVLACAIIAPAIAAVTLARQGHREAWLLSILPGFVGMLVVLARVVALAIVRLDFEKRWYVVTDRSLRVREGVVTIREMTITFANIQNISISQGPVQRALGIADLRVDTAGGGAVTQAKQAGQNLHTAWLRGVNNANEVRELIQQRLRQFKGAGLGDQEEEIMAQRAQSAPASHALLEALRALRDEAQSLRQTVSRASP